MKVRITQVRSTIKSPANQKLNIKALGLGKINKFIEVELTPTVAGKVEKVKHLVNVENI